MKTKEEEKISYLYERYNYAKKRRDMGKKNKDYESIMEDIRWQINEITNTNISDDEISLKYVGSNIGVNCFDVMLLKNKETIGKIIVKREGKVGILNYSFFGNHYKLEYELKAIKLLIGYMQKQEFERIEMSVLKEDKQKNYTMLECGGRKNLLNIAPYNEYTIKLK